MKAIKRSVQMIIASMIVCLSACSGQQIQGWQLEKMPPDLETQFALSSLPPRLRSEATVYLLDPTKGYYMAKQGTNGLTAFVMRTQWEKAEFLPNDYSPMSYDEAGAKTFVPMYFDVAAMRATGKYSAAQIRDTIVQRVKVGIYKAPSRTGISYMLCPITLGQGDN